MRRVGGAVVALVCLLVSIGCAAPNLRAALESELVAARQAAWEARRQANRAGVFAETAERRSRHAGVRAERAETLALAPAPVPAGAWSKAERVRVLKGERRLDLLRDGEVVRSFRIALGFAPVGGKQYQGDGRTPEGLYRVDSRRETRRYGPGLHVSYPSDADRRRARSAGVAPGGGIFIHGLPRGLGIIGADHAKWDWTNGCIAVTDAELAELWERIDDGTEIEILP